MPRTVTALRSTGRQRVAVELDGAPWRTFPGEAVVRAGLSVGLGLERPVLRVLRRELRRAEALGIAGRALRTRDLSAKRLEQRLDRAKVGRAARAEALAVLERAGLVDDARVARGRAAALAERGHGDAAIRADLERQGIEPELAAEAVGELVPETERARVVAGRRGRNARTARFLAGKGFSADSIEAALSADFANTP